MNDTQTMLGLDERVRRLEENYHNQDKQALKDKFELSTMITKAVADGNIKTIELFEKFEMKFDEKIKGLDMRTCELENQDAKKSQMLLKTITKTIITTTAGWIILSFLNNYLALTTNQIKSNIKEEVETYEIYKNVS